MSSHLSCGLGPCGFTAIGVLLAVFAGEVRVVAAQAPDASTPDAPPDEVPVDDAPPDDAPPDDALPDDALPDDALPDDALPDDALPDDAPPDAPPTTSDPPVNEDGTPRLVPPELLQEGALERPPGLSLHVPTSVLLRLTIDEEGGVAEVEVVEGAGPPFDNLAVDVLRRSRFRPAERGGTPIASRVMYRWILRPLPSPEPRSVDAGAGPAEVEEDRTRPDDGGSSEEDPGLGATAVVDRDREGVLERTAEAVNVVDVAAQRTRARDLGDVLAREQGIGLQRAGGLGSGSRFSLGGLTDDQIRFFLDGIPIELAGFRSIANIPVVGIDAVEIYRGVVPIRLGADALGGVVNLRTGDAERRTFGLLSYQYGSFNTHRVAAVARYYDRESGLTAGIRGFFDSTDNDYRVLVPIADETGGETDQNVPRFHDDYLAYNVNLDVGILDRPWARRLQLNLYTSGANRDLQHNVVMTRPYGEARLQERSHGGSVRWDVEDGGLTIETVFALGWGREVIDDRGCFSYSWLGERIGRERSPCGEIDGSPLYRELDDLTAFGRVYAEWAFSDDHAIGVAFTPRFSTRTGDNRLTTPEDGRDPLSVRQDLGTLVSGISYRATFWDGRIENRLFGKHYFTDLSTEELLFGGNFQPVTRREQYGGVGNGLRVQIVPDWLWTKLSYEWAVRLPDAAEVFGNGGLVRSNLEIEPERSHNLNFSLQLDHSDGPAGRFQGEVNVFVRLADNLIVFIPSADSFFAFRNVFEAQIFGTEASLRWTSPGKWVTAGVNFTYQDVRNRSSDGLFATFDGDRIPNRPFMFANGNIAVNWADAFFERDELSAGGDVRFVEEFFRGWESQGAPIFQPRVDQQLTLGLFAAYRIELPVTLTTTFEVQNVTDARVFDFFGVQRPGRSFFLKIAGEVQ